MIINEVDSLMAIFGYKRVICAECVHSQGTDKGDMLCTAKNVLVERNAQCKLFEREPGSDE